MCDLLYRPYIYIYCSGFLTVRCVAHVLPHVPATCGFLLIFRLAVSAFVNVSVSRLRGVLVCFGYSYVVNINISALTEVMCL